jgi:hypothetical protein
MRGTNGMRLSFTFSKLRFFFTEFFFMGRAHKSPLRFVEWRRGLALMLPAFAVLGETLTLQQSLFFFSSSNNYAVANRPRVHRIAQSYADRKGALWGVTNQHLLTSRNISKGRESYLAEGSGVVFNTSPALLKRSSWCFLRGLDLVFISVGIQKGSDFPLLVTPRTSEQEGALLEMCQRFLNQNAERVPHALSSMVVLALLRKIAALAAPLVGGRGKQVDLLAQKRRLGVGKKVELFRDRYAIWLRLRQRRQFAALRRSYSKTRNDFNFRGSQKQGSQFRGSKTPKDGRKRF